MTAADMDRFAAICEEEASREESDSFVGIGTYGEKRLHRIFKRYACDDETAHEIPVGKYVADVYAAGRITEIQTKNLGKLLPKLRYYLEQTDAHVTVVYPVFAEKLLIRMDRETGEILRSKRSPKKGKAEDLLPLLYPLSELFFHPRLCFRVVLIRAEELRFSERMRYRRKGAYDAELYPRSLVGEESFCHREDFLRFLPTDTPSFTAAEYGAWAKLKARKLYSALNFLCAVGLLYREKEGKHYRYFVEAELDGMERE